MYICTYIAKAANSEQRQKHIIDRKCNKVFVSVLKSSKNNRAQHLQQKLRNFGFFIYTHLFCCWSLESRAEMFENLFMFLFNTLSPQFHRRYEYKCTHRSLKAWLRPRTSNSQLTIPCGEFLVVKVWKALYIKSKQTSADILSIAFFNICRVLVTVN